MVLSANKESIIKVMRRLPPQEAEKVSIGLSNSQIWARNAIWIGPAPGRTTIFGTLQSYLSRALRGVLLQVVPCDIVAAGSTADWAALRVRLEVGSRVHQKRASATMCWRFALVYMALRVHEIVLA
jgi:hypothetical protein